MKAIVLDANLALAEGLGVEFWTADGVLARNVRRIGITWVRSVVDV